MTFRKFVAATTRDCLRMMREALGADAMIVSTRRTSGGVEVVGIRSQDMPGMAEEPAQKTTAPEEPAAVNPQTSGDEVAGITLWDHIEDEPVRLSPAARVLAQQDEHDLTETVEPQDLPLADWPRIQPQQIPHLVRAENLGSEHRHDVVALSSAPLRQTPSRSEENLRRSMEVESELAPMESVLPTVQGVRTFDGEERAALASQVSEPIMSEMRSMRGWLERQMDIMSWRDCTQREPQRRSLWQRLIDAGFTPELARTVAARLPQDYSKEQADRWLVEVLVRNLACVSTESSIVEQGGRYTIVGPTGVGKTTTTAKIAAHCVVKYGAASLGLISTDQHRIGAVDQLRTFAKILGVEVYVARGASDLEVLLASMADRRLVLIDTAGVSQRDEQMNQHLQAITVEGVQRLLVVPAGSHAEQTEDIVRGYSAGGLAGMIVSKMDEAVRLGGALDAAVRHRIPLHYMTNGQRVPEDLHTANARLLVHRALRARNAPVFALDAEELVWACMASPEMAGSSSGMCEEAEADPSGRVESV